MNILMAARAAFRAYFDAVDALVDGVIIECRNIACLNERIELTQEDERRLREIAKAMREAGL